MRPFPPTLNKIILKDNMRLHPDVNTNNMRKSAVTRIVNKFNTLEKLCREIHGNKFSYKFFKYYKMTVPSWIYCHKCKKLFKQTMNAHINVKSGCNVCARIESGKNRALTIEQIKERLNLLPNSFRYTYYLKNIKNLHSKIKIKCWVCNYTFIQDINSHLGGRGCPNCCKTGFKASDPAKL